MNVATNLCLPCKKPSSPEPADGAGREQPAYVRCWKRPFWLVTALVVSVAGNIGLLTIRPAGEPKVPAAPVAAVPAVLELAGLDGRKIQEELEKASSGITDSVKLLNSLADVTGLKSRLDDYGLKLDALSSAVAGRGEHITALEKQIGDAISWILSPPDVDPSSRRQPFSVRGKVNQIPPADSTLQANQPLSIQ